MTSPDNQPQVPNIEGQATHARAFSLSPVDAEKLRLEIATAGNVVNDADYNLLRANMEEYAAATFQFIVSILGKALPQHTMKFITSANLVHRFMLVSGSQMHDFAHAWTATHSSHEIAGPHTEGVTFLEGRVAFISDQSDAWSLLPEEVREALVHEIGDDKLVGAAREASAAQKYARIRMIDAIVEESLHMIQVPLPERTSEILVRYLKQHVLVAMGSEAFADELDEQCYNYCQWVINDHHTTNNQLERLFFGSGGFHGDERIKLIVGFESDQWPPPQKDQ